MNDYINLDDKIDENDIFQIQIEGTELIIKKIGKSNTNNDIILCKNIGRKKNITLFSIVYTQDELTYYEDLGKIYNLIKLHEKEENKDKLFNLSVKINEKIEINKIITDYEIFFISNEIYDDNKKYLKKIDNIINKNNIIEIVIKEYILLQNS